MCGVALRDLSWLRTLMMGAMRTATFAGDVWAITDVI